MEVANFVAQRFGAAEAARLARIRMGGDNNRKGDAFETYYAAAKVCNIAANQHDLDDFILSSQELAFVDDLCLRQKSASVKVNYQAKNSSGGAASWDDDMELRFRMQCEIDENVHKFPNNKQILLVSCADKAAANDAKIPADLKDLCGSEFFPYEAKSTLLLYRSPQLRGDLERICESDDLSVLDAAFRIVVSAWTCDEHPRSVGDIIGLAKSMAKPNMFAQSVTARPGPPGWLHGICLAFQGLQARVEFGNFIVSYNGLDVSLGANPPEPEASVLSSLDSVGNVFALLMSMAQAELKGTDE